MKIILKDGTTFKANGQEKFIKEQLVNHSDILKIKNGTNSYYINIKNINYVDEEDNKND
ncbi:hypothetical protein [Mammaliicoccus virus vB_MscM-PMS2]|nr:hypothetical protein [Mammaliicoccus virus vB_MscM-PMS2]